MIKLNIQKFLIIAVLCCNSFPLFSQNRETDFSLSAGTSHFTLRDRVISSFAYQGLGVGVEFKVGHRNEFIKYGFNFKYQQATPTTEMRKGFLYDGDFINDTVNGVNGSEVQLELTDFSLQLMFNLNKKSEGKLNIWLGASGSYLGITKKYLILNHQNLNDENYLSISPACLVEYQPFEKHRFYYGVDFSLLGSASREFQYNLKPLYFDNSEYITLEETKGTYGLGKLFFMNSILGYRFRIIKNLGLNAEYQLIYNRLAEPLESRMVRQQFVFGLSFIL